MTTLHDRLAELAGDAPTGAPDPDLWDRGRTLHRRRRAGTVLIAAACVLLVTALSLLDWRVSRPVVGPASTTGALALPDTIEEPSPWLAGTAGQPFGPLAAMVASDRGSWTGTEPGLVGISAATGEYRFLDLPSYADGGAALSPTGRYVGYWLTGSPEGSPGDPENEPVIGFAVYDVVTGRTAMREDVHSEHGLMPDAMTWIDEGDLGVSFSRLRAYDDKLGTSGRPTEARLTRVPDGRVTPYQGSISDGGGGGWILATWGNPSSLRPLAGDSHATTLLGESGVRPVVDPSGELVAGLRTIRRSNGTVIDAPVPLAVARLDHRRRVRLEAVPGGRRYFDIVGWRDDHTVLVLRPGDHGYTPNDVYAVDARTGQASPLLSVQGGIYPQYAASLLDLPVVSRPEPPHPWDPRVMAGLVAGVVIVSGAALLLWRRRVRP